MRCGQRRDEFQVGGVRLCMRACVCGSLVSLAVVVYLEVIAHKPNPDRDVVNNRRAVTEGRCTQTRIAIKVKDGCVL